MGGISPDRDSLESALRRTSISSGGQSHKRKEFLHRFVNIDILKISLASWFESIFESNTSRAFDVPFELIDLQKFDYALEGVQFQQLVRMPNTIHASTTSDMEASAYLALEDFLYTSGNSLWKAFWGHDDESMPFYVSSLFDENFRFYQAEEAIAKGKAKGFTASAIMVKNPRHRQGRWEDIVELALLRPNVQSLGSIEEDLEFFSVLGEALFFALRVLLARSISKSGSPLSLNAVFVLIVDSQLCSVIKVEGDLNKLEVDQNNVYESAANWFKNYSHIAISPVDRIWNKLGNANWGDIGALQGLYATFHSITQYAGMPKITIEDLAADHSSRIQTRRIERHLGDTRLNGNSLSRFQHCTASPEIVEVQEESIKVESKEKWVKLEVGDVLLLEDSSWRNGYRIDQVLNDGEILFYIASSVEDPGNAVFLYVGSHPSQLEPAWQDMKLWYQVQRQTKVLNVMKQKGVSSKYLPQVRVSGRVVHPGQCRKQNSGGKCDHPWCGTPALVTSPVGIPVADMVRAGQFSADEAIGCCHDCLSALSASSAAGVYHGDIRPENVVCLKSVGRPYYVIIGWGHAILEERDRPALSLYFSSTSALEEGKLYSASDAESLVYMLYFCSGGDLPVLDSVEGALQWRETAWSRRLIQQKLGDISAVLKAFADYVDSLCGTPYPVNYEIWLRRLRRHIHGEDSGKEVDNSPC